MSSQNPMAESVGSDVTPASDAGNVVAGVDLQKAEQDYIKQKRDVDVSIILENWLKAEDKEHPEVYVTGWIALFA